MKEDKVVLLNQLKENSYWIYQYINTDILKNIGEMDSYYFIKIMQDIFTEKIDVDFSKYTNNLNILPYFIFTLIAGIGKLDYTSLRVDTINFNKLNKEALVYYNYAEFILHEHSLTIQLMQTKIGGMPIDKDIIKFEKNIPIKNLGLEEFIIKHQKETISREAKSLSLKIKESINNII